MRKPKVLILGYARHGKDTVAEILRDNHGYTFASSSHFLAQMVVRPYLAQRGHVYATLGDCYEDRVNHRAMWKDAIAEYNADDPAALTKAILQEHDIYVGMRMQRELDAARPLFDAVVWVDASRRGLPPEDPSSMDIKPDNSMLFIDNGESLLRLTTEVASLAAYLDRIPVKAALPDWAWAEWVQEQGIGE